MRVHELFPRTVPPLRAVRVSNAGAARVRTGMYVGIIRLTSSNRTICTDSYALLGTGGNNEA